MVLPRVAAADRDKPAARVVHAHALYQAARLRPRRVPVVIQPGAPNPRYLADIRQADALVADGWAARPPACSADRCAIPKGWSGIQPCLTSVRGLEGSLVSCLSVVWCRSRDMAYTQAYGLAIVVIHYPCSWGWDSCLRAKSDWHRRSVTFAGYVRQEDMAQCTRRGCSR